MAKSLHWFEMPYFPRPNQRLTNKTDSGIFEKHATPANAAAQMEVALGSMRPVSLFPDRSQASVAPQDISQILVLGKHYKLNVSTSSKSEINQWNSQYISLAFPYSYPRPLGGADWPHRERLRRDDAAPAFAHGHLPPASPPASKAASATTGDLYRL